MTDVVGKLWGYASTLRHDGVDYGDYIEQLTYMLFLKMADEQGIDLPAYADEKDNGEKVQVPCDWPFLRKQSGTDLTAHYTKALITLGKQPGMLGDIFGGAQNRLANPATLARLVKAIDETEWTSLEVDVKAAAFEGLLEKSAAEGKKGAGQYFTPRPLIRAMVSLIQPDPRANQSFSITDPACGTGGFLVAAYEWLKEQTGGALDRETARRVKTSTYYGQELVARPRRLALMNLYLHQVEPQISLGDSIYEVPGSERFNVVLTNPPFGNRGASQVPQREDFTIETANKQLNFLQHILTILKVGGRAAVVVPDNVLFADKAGEVFEILMKDADVHTVLRCPRGTFTPYTEGTNTNVIFFTKGRPTTKVWIFDARANIPKITKVARPLTDDFFDEFMACYGTDPNGLSPRREDMSGDGRWRVFGMDEVKHRDYKIDSFKWLRDEELDDPDEIGDPAELLSSALAELQAAVAEMEGLRHFVADEVDA
ncbi:putative type I restriction enzymeP M protein [Arthrobacter sp. SO5]|uniref:class I SAM-dependent DNA methyltransferase n=1 Tax=Arthrobacter sp. SO5 TaxID=1897055 RepID=UPI001E619F85|nr:class I SAM-dependent DNA methyltransferase [Arthrobacter sp. SO5]MCB5275918.1 putative type I restriction enzymeP M protein [Arthrobacter sp. SO5]